jgi:hypothetical protein
MRLAESYVPGDYLRRRALWAYLTVLGLVALVSAVGYFDMHPACQPSRGSAHEG